MLQYSHDLSPAPTCLPPPLFVSSRWFSLLHSSSLVLHQVTRQLSSSHQLLLNARLVSPSLSASLSARFRILSSPLSAAWAQATHLLISAPTPGRLAPVLGMVARLCDLAHQEHVVRAHVAMAPSILSLQSVSSSL